MLEFGVVKAAARRDCEIHWFEWGTVLGAMLGWFLGPFTGHRTGTCAVGRHKSKRRNDAGANSLASFSSVII